MPGGVDYQFDDVSSEGSCFGEYSKADASELAVHVAAGEFEPFTFLTPGEPSQIWEMSFSGVFSGQVHLTFGYDPQGRRISKVVSNWTGSAWSIATVDGSGTVAVVAVIYRTYGFGMQTSRSTFALPELADLGHVQLQSRLPNLSLSGAIVALWSASTTAEMTVAILLVVALNSPKGTHDSLFLSNYATQNVLDELKRQLDI